MAEQPGRRRIRRRRRPAVRADAGLGFRAVRPEQPGLPRRACRGRHRGLPRHRPGRGRVPDRPWPELGRSARQPVPRHRSVLRPHRRRPPRARVAARPGWGGGQVDPGPVRLTKVAHDAGFTRVRLAMQTPFNIVFEVRPWPAGDQRSRPPTTAAAVAG